MSKFKVLLFSADSQFLVDHQRIWSRGQHFQWAQTHEKAIFLIKEWEPEILILDSLEKLISMRDPINSQLPRLGIVVASHLGSGSEEEKALKAGADMFVYGSSLGPPLGWRVAALARRLLRTRNPLASLDQQVLTFGPLKLEVEKGLVSEVGRPSKPLSPLQCRLLQIFLTHPEKLLSRDALKHLAWEDAEVSPRSIDAQVSKLKKAVPCLENYIFNVYGKGYLLTRDRSKAA